jgi:hypothetical protein
MPGCQRRKPKGIVSHPSDFTQEKLQKSQSSPCAGGKVREPAEGPYVEDRSWCIYELRTCSTKGKQKIAKK